MTLAQRLSCSLAEFSRTALQSEMLCSCVSKGTITLGPTPGKAAVPTMITWDNHALAKTRGGGISTGTKVSLWQDVEGK